MPELDTQFVEGIDAIYSTVLDAGRWPEALERVAAAGGAFGSMLMVTDSVHSGLEMNVLSERIGAAEADAYVHEQLSADELQWDVALEEVPALTLLTDEQIWPDRSAYDAMPSVQWLKSWHFYHRSAARLCAHGGWKDTLAIVHNDDHPATSPEEAARVGSFLPHLARAVELRRPFTLLRNRYQAILSVLDRLGIGVMIVLRDGHILVTNSEAERILAAGDGPKRDSDGRLGLPDRSGTKAQRASLRRALSRVYVEGDPAGGIFHLDRAPGRTPTREPYVVDLSLLRDDGVELGEPVSATLMCVIDPDRREVVSTEALGAVYGLTAAEAAVCALIADGRANAEIAEIRGVSIETVKVQSKAIYRKTRCANRLELVRRALSISPPVAGRGGGRDD